METSWNMDYAPTLKNKNPTIPMPRMVLTGLLTTTATLNLSAATGDTPTEDTLAKAAQNPVANMISVPFQNNFNFGVGPDNATQYILNVQPVIPFAVSEDWNLVTRTIVPIINQPSPAPGIPSAAGLGDINPTGDLGHHRR